MEPVEEVLLMARGAFCPFLPSRRIAADVRAELLRIMYLLSEQDFQSLDEENQAWLPRLGILKHHTAVQEIRRVLEASSTVSLCLERAAWIYCWLASRGTIHPWMLLRLGAYALQVDWPTTLKHLAHALPSAGRPTALSIRHVQGRYYACMIYQRSCTDAREHEVMCLVLCRGHRVAAACAQTKDGWLALMAALNVALLGESVELQQGLHESVDAAFSAALRGDGGSLLIRVDRDTCAAASLSGASEPQQQLVDLS
ncbi:hypothetical protein HPB50_026668 [Hyalomma asiaticum]|uniref:Uncharacterized protein n=1 Tax=Hyalomma asiaticum TaxID=266040 RepID=A0ACB7RPP8_HYAAI|nr:hypothetical protein HPB50_026668 [Hyalomma asiaticum]